MHPPFAICRDGEPVPESLEGALAAIGNFDGVHRGHQHLLKMTLDSGRPAAVVTFEPHPRTFFQPDRPLFRLTPEPVKLKIFARLGLAGVFQRRFNGSLAALTAAGFVDLLAHDLRLSGVVIGHDFHFGRSREGNPARMAELCRERGLDCLVAPAIVEGTEPVSSSAIRSALEAGDIAAANRLLGYRWFVQAEVRHGDKRGRVLGYPTANMRLARRLPSPARHLRRQGVRRTAGRSTASRISAGGLPSITARRCSKCISSTSPAISTGRHWMWNSSAGSAARRRFDSIEALIAQMDRDFGQGEADACRGQDGFDDRLIPFRCHPGRSAAKIRDRF